MVLVRLTNFGTVGMITIAANIPLFAVAGLRVGKKFFFASLIGMLFCSVSIDLFAAMPRPETEPLVAALYGGLLCGIGLGTVFAGGGSTGGSDIIVRLLKKKWPNVQIGVISMCFDLVVVALTGIVLKNIQLALYSGVAIFVTGRVIDAVVYSFDYSRVALIITGQYETIAKAITEQLDRGVTYLDGEGYYSGKQTKVILTAVKRQQLAELKALVVGIDPDAFVIVQEAHQVLGDGFSRYSQDSL
jgi:uncharacterized membrane-anchored protein YitT (DUF2179 family)